MYDTQIIAERIRERAKTSNFSMREMFSDLGLGINTVSHLAKGQEMSYLKFAKIADYLNCSVDYLLGRTDTPNGSYVNGNNSVLKVVTGTRINDNSHVTITDTAGKDNLTEEFIKLFDTLAFLDKVKVINFVSDMTQK